MVALKIWKNRLYYAMILPALVLSCCIILIPALQTIVTSFMEWNGIGSTKIFIGLDNFKELLNNRIFKKAITNNIKWMGMYLCIPLVISLVVSFFLYRRKEGRTFFQSLYMIPYIIAPIANSIIWLNMIYSPLSGVFSFLNMNLGLQLKSPLSNPATALFGVGAVSIWRYWGFLSIVFLAALRQIPVEQIEAAKVEGATGFQVYRYVAFPNILPTVRLMIALIIIQSFILYDYIYLLTKGGPANSTEVLGTVAYSYAFSRFRFGMASATSLIMALLGIAPSILYISSNHKEMQN